MKNFEVAALPYAMDALEPHISSETVRIHYELHHKGYMKKLQAALEGRPEAEQTLEAIVRSTSGDVFNNAAQVFNHTFFWQSMSPKGGGEPPVGPVKDLFTRDFGSWDAFRSQFIQTGEQHFGSGWVWLVISKGRAKIISTANADNPLTTSAKPLLTADVWEHAYYLDYQNERKAFLQVFCDRLINWDFVLENLQA